MMFLKLCDTALSTFSNRYFKDNFFNDYMDMSRDPVSNIRLKFLTLVPRVRKCFVLPKDSNLLYRLTDTIGSLMTSEPCYDVSTSAKSNLRFMKSDSSEADNPSNRLKEEEEDLIAKICGDAAKEASKSGASKITKGVVKAANSTPKSTAVASVTASSEQPKTGSMNSLLSDRSTSASRKSSASIKPPDTKKPSTQPALDPKKLTSPQDINSAKRLSTSNAGPSTPVKNMPTKISASLPTPIPVKAKIIPSALQTPVKIPISTTIPTKLASVTTAKPVQPIVPLVVPNTVKKPVIGKKI